VKTALLPTLAVATALTLTGCSAAESPPPVASTDAPTGRPTDEAMPGGAPTTAPPATVEGPDYRDGEYTARGWYGGLPSHQDVTLTLDAGVVTAVSMTTPAENPTSLGHQQDFAEAVPDEVIGRDVDDVQVSRLAGASGCSEGFMDALAKIKADAAAQ
jgi:uncharacterized protein with FMN-binding domain